MGYSVKSFDYVREVDRHEGEILDVVRRVLRSGTLLLGPETEALENELARFLGAAHCVAVASGTMALQLGLMALDAKPGDEIVSVANTCSPTMASALVLGCRPVFVDVDPATLMMDPRLLEEAITERTRAIIPVHLWGQSPDVDAVLAAGDRRGLPVIEDCAQSFGTLWRGRPTGTFGRLGCFSFYPTKNLGTFGDAGAVVTNDGDLAARLRRLRMYGYGATAISEEAGTNGRISEIQAGLLRWKLRGIEVRLAKRRRFAEAYRRGIRHEAVGFPSLEAECTASYHQFVVRTERRDALRAHLESRGVQSLIHYPEPLHRMPAYQAARCVPDGLPATREACGQVLSLPLHDTISEGEIEAVIEAVNSFDGADQPGHRGG